MSVTFRITHRTCVCMQGMQVHAWMLQCTGIYTHVLSHANTERSKRGAELRVMYLQNCKTHLAGMHSHIKLD